MQIMEDVQLPGTMTQASSVIDGGKLLGLDRSVLSSSHLVVVGCAAVRMSHLGLTYAPAYAYAGCKRLQRVGTTSWKARARWKPSTVLESSTW